MLFLVSGTSRSGKTLVAKKILADERIPYLSLDWLTGQSEVAEGAADIGYAWRQAASESP